MPAAITAEERMRIRDALGYMSVSPAASIHFGSPRPTVATFLVESAIDNLLDVAIPRVRELLGRVETVERDLFDARRRLKAARVGEIDLRGIVPGETETDALEREQLRWSMRLADTLGVPINMYSERYHNALSHTGLNISARRP